MILQSLLTGYSDELDVNLVLCVLSYAFLQQAKTNLIQRVVKCIGCEKALKLFRDTKEVQMHGGMWTKDNQRRYSISLVNVSCAVATNPCLSPLKP